MDGLTAAMVLDGSWQNRQRWWLPAWGSISVEHLTPQEVGAGTPGIMCSNSAVLSRTRGRCWLSSRPACPLASTKSSNFTDGAPSDKTAGHSTCFCARSSMDRASDYGVGAALRSARIRPCRWCHLGRRAKQPVSDAQSWWPIELLTPCTMFARVVPGVHSGGSTRSRPSCRKSTKSFWLSVTSGSWCRIQQAATHMSFWGRGRPLRWAAAARTPQVRATVGS